MRILVAQINTAIGAVNTEKIIAAVRHARKSNVDIVVFPELAVCGNHPKDLLFDREFVDLIEQQLPLIVKETQGITAIVGTIRRENGIFNTAAVIRDGQLLGFSDSSETKLWDIGIKAGITTGDSFDEITGSEIVFNLSSTPFEFSKNDEKYSIAARNIGCPILICNQVGGQGNIIFDGHSVAVNKNGNVFARAKGFEEDLLLVDLDGENSCHQRAGKIEGIYNALVLGVHDYFGKAGFSSAVLGISGGLDSAVVACIVTKALGKGNVLGITMPSRYTTEESKQNSLQLISNLGIRHEDIPIEKTLECYLAALTPHFKGKKTDVTEENLQARIRGMILMAMANKHNMLTLNTGNKSEVACGYCTLYGDTCGSISILSDITKTEVYQLAKFINRENQIIPEHAITREPSAELRHGQKDTDSLPDYETLDNILNAYLNHHSLEEISAKYNYPTSLIKQTISRIQNNEYKRRQLPPALIVSNIPLQDLRIPL